MEQALFDDLVQSLKEAKAIARGEAPASRRTEVKPLDVKAVREQIGLSQSEFARLMRVSIKTVQNWEQHHRNPTGPAAALLKIVLTAPDVALKALHASLNAPFCVATLPDKAGPAGRKRCGFPRATP